MIGPSIDPVLAFLKLLRLWFLVLLAAMLPVRGAIAAAMLCPPAGLGTQGHAQSMHHDAAGHAHADGVDPHAQHLHADGTLHDHGSASDKCNLCSAFCSLTPLWSEVAGIVEPDDLRDVAFPRLSAPAPTSRSGRQERPPRSI